MSAIHIKSLYLFNATATIEMVENVPSVMLVHPHGCVEMENIAVFLASQLNTFGVKVYLDILQTQKIANEGLSKVLLDNFKDADYVALLCMEGIERGFIISVTTPKPAFNSFLFFFQIKQKKTQACSVSCFF